MAPASEPGGIAVVVRYPSACNSVQQCLLHPCYIEVVILIGGGSTSLQMQR